jgi:hypothetical protein
MTTTGVQRQGSAAWFGREFHLVDIENLVGGPFFTAQDVADVREVYLGICGAAWNAQVVVACSAGRSLLEAGMGWPNCRRVWESGQDGADRALLEIAWSEHLPARFARVVIGSGDGIFAEAAAMLQAAGLHVTVVSRYGSLSRRLRLAALDLRILPDAPRSPWMPKPDAA